MARNNSELQREADSLRNGILQPYFLARRFFAGVGVFATIQYVVDFPPATTVFAAVAVAVLVKTIESTFTRR